MMTFATLALLQLAIAGGNLDLDRYRYPLSAWQPLLVELMSPVQR